MKYKIYITWGMNVWTVKAVVSTWAIAKKVRMQYIDKGFKTKIRKFD